MAPVQRASFLPAILAFVALSCRGQETAPEQEGVADPKATPSTFVRLVETSDREGRFELAVTHYSNGEGVSVDLAAAVHIADGGHYQELNERFKGYDALLFELVGHPEDAKKLKERKNVSGVGLLQRLMKDGLELEFQLDAVDYTPDNFVHADLTPEEFQELSEKRGETLVTLMFRAMSAEMKRQREEAADGGDGEKLDLAAAFRRREGRHMMRWVLAGQLEGMERMTAGFAGPDGESVLVEGRNARAIEVLQREIKAGKRKLGIYYGAAHMQDMEERLLGLGFQKTGESWSIAWDLSLRKDKDRYVSTRRKDDKR